MRIGLSIITSTGHNLWSNGLGQNVYHLACLLEHLPFVESVVLLNCGDQAEPPAGGGEFARRFPLLSLREATDLIDIAIEVSGALDREWIAQFRARGGKVVFHSIGQPYAALVDPTTFSKPGCFSVPERCDEVWLIEKDWQFEAMMRSIHRCPIFQVPLIWAPAFLQETIRHGDGQQFGYKPGTLARGQAVAAILEPNLSPIKMGLIPFMICEKAFRLQRDAIGHVHMFNAAQFAGHATFAYLIEHSDLKKADKITIYPRDYFSHIMGRGANMVVSHQLDCAQNYLYLDCLAGDYPLIHNSPLFADAGYFYPDSDVAAGAGQVLQALREHDHNLATYRTRARARMEAHNPINRRNLDIYARRLLALFSESGRCAA